MMIWIWKTLFLSGWNKWFLTLRQQHENQAKTRYQRVLASETTWNVEKFPRIPFQSMKLLAMTLIL